MDFNAEREPTKYELEAIEAIRQSHINLPTQDFQKTKLWSEKLKAGQYEVKPESVCNCTATERKFLDTFIELDKKGLPQFCDKNERMFLDEIRELYEWNDHLGFPHLQRKEITKYSNIYQQDFKKTNLKELVNE